MSSASPRALPRTAFRIVMALFAVVMLASLAGHGDVLALTPLGSQISSGRRSQAYYESVMLSQDKAIASIKAQSKITRKALKQAGKAFGRARKQYRSTAPRGGRAAVPTQLSSKRGTRTRRPRRSRRPTSHACARCAGRSARPCGSARRQLVSCAPHSASARRARSASGC